MEALITILGIINKATLAINAATSALTAVQAIIQPALDEGRDLTDDERQAIRDLARNQAEETKSILQAIVDSSGS